MTKKNEDTDHEIDKVDKERIVDIQNSGYTILGLEKMRRN